VQQRLLETPRGHFVFRATRAAKDSCYAKDGPKIWSTALKRTIERHLFIASEPAGTDQVTTGETISVDWNGMTSRLMFLKKSMREATAR